MHILKPPYSYYSKSIRDYCLNSTNEYIKKITEKNNLERTNKLIKINNPLISDNNDKPEQNFDIFLI